MSLTERRERLLQEQQNSAATQKQAAEAAEQERRRRLVPLQQEVLRRIKADERYQTMQSVIHSSELAQAMREMWAFWAPTDKVIKKTKRQVTKEEPGFFRPKKVVQEVDHLVEEMVPVAFPGIRFQEPDSVEKLVAEELEPWRRSQRIEQSLAVLEPGADPRILEDVINSWLQTYLGQCWYVGISGNSFPHGHRESGDNADHLRYSFGITFKVSQGKLVYHLPGWTGSKTSGSGNLRSESTYPIFKDFSTLDEILDQAALKLTSCVEHYSPPYDNWG